MDVIPFAPQSKLQTIRLLSKTVLDKVLPDLSRELAGAATSAPTTSALRSPLASLPAERLPSSPAPDVPRPRRPHHQAPWICFVHTG